MYITFSVNYYYRALKVATTKRSARGKKKKNSPATNKYATRTAAKNELSSVVTKQEANFIVSNYFIIFL